MNPELSQIVPALVEIAAILDKLGVYGLVALVLSGPVIILLAVISAEVVRSRRLHAIIEAQRAENRYLLEAYRKDNQQAIKELGEHQEQTDAYYRDNVELVRNYERIAGNLQSVVIGNTGAITELKTFIRAKWGL